MVHLGHLDLELVVGDGPQSLHDHGVASLTGELDQQAAERGHLDAGHARACLLEHRDALVDAEHRLLRGVLEHRHHHHLERLARALDDVEVTVGDGIERPRTQGGQAQ